VTGKPTSLRIARITAGLSQVSLADRIGTYQERLSRIERGRTPPDAEEIQRLSEVLQTPPEQLFSRMKTE
jgi:transcriptional regulator with XRE-family HTH domain